MKPRRGSKPRHKFKFTLTVNHITFPKHITRRLSSSKFYILLSRADKNSQTKVGSISKSGKIEYNESISLEATLLKNRSSNSYISKHCRLVLRQIKNSSSTNNPTANSSSSSSKIRESSVGSIKFDLVDYIDRIPSEQKLTFSKCALPDVFISCIIKSQELEIIDTDNDNMSVTSANTIRVDSFWLDENNCEQKVHQFHMNSEGNGNCNEEEAEGAIIQLTDDNLMEFGNGSTHRQKDMAKFRIKHAMDIMANENDIQNTYFDNNLLNELEKSRDKISIFEKIIYEKDLKIQHFCEEERKWNKCMIEWEREKSNFEASTIDINFKYQKEKQKSENYKTELNEMKLKLKRFVIEKEKLSVKYNNLCQSLSANKNELLQQLSEMQRDYDDLEESLLLQQMSWRDTGNILEKELEKKKMKCVCVLNELKKYKSKCYNLEKENGKFGKKIEFLQKELYRMKNENIAIKMENNNVKNGEEDLNNNKKRRNSSVMDAVKKFNSVNTNENKKRRKSGKLKRKSVSNVDENNLKENRKSKLKKKNVKIGPVLRKMSATKLSSVKNMINKIETEENIMIEQELLSPVINIGENDIKIENIDNGNNCNELGDISNVVGNGNNNNNMDEIGRNISVSDNDEMDVQKDNHQHRRSDHSLGGNMNDLGINFDELNAMGNSGANLSEDENDNLSDLSGSGNNGIDNQEIVHDID